jgi:hypothetical protein
MRFAPPARAAVPIVAAAAVTVFAACMSSTSSSTSPSPSVTQASSMMPPSPDPRVGLAAGTTDSVVIDGQSRRVIGKPAAEAAWNVRLLSNSPSTGHFHGVTNSDLAFTGNFAIQGNYDGYQVWDISNPRKPDLKTAYWCPASQSDVSVYKNLLFVSAEGQTGRHDCGAQGVQDTVSTMRVRGIRIFDITDITKPRYITDVQTCRGSHTHTVLVPPGDPENIYVYISGSSSVRPEGELGGCADLSPENSPNSSQFRIEVIKVPVAHPEQAARVSQPHIFQDLAAPPVNSARSTQDSIENANRPARGGRGGAPGGAAGGRAGGRGGPRIRQGPTQCHDITVYPAIGFAGGACGGYGLLLDIRDPANPKRVSFVADSNFSFWHSATFSNDGSKVLFTDEWGGGSAPRCRSTDKMQWGADAIFTISGTNMNMKGYYKMPAAQTSQENCVAHNGSLIPIPGREVMVQGWYQGGISVFDWTDPAHAREIAFFDRGPLDAGRLVSGGSWSVYWYNGVLVSSEIARGLDVFELEPSAFLSQNELDAAKTVHFEYLNAQGQPHLVWPASFSLSGAYLDQLGRSQGLSDGRITAVRAALATAQKASGQARRDGLTALATQLDGDASSSRDGAKVRTLAASVRDLANATR